MVEQRVFACVRDADVPILAAALPPSVQLEIGASPQLVAVLNRAGTIAAIVDDRLGVNAVSTRFLELACAGVRWPAIQILRERDARWARAASWAASALHVNECRARLWYVLRARIIEWRLSVAAECTRAQCQEAEELGNALYVALLTDRPFTTVAELARASGSSRALLYEQWSAVFGADCELTLHRFVQWVLLLRGLAASDARGTGDRTVARRLGVLRSTLGHAADDLLGRTFSDVEENLALKPLADFEARLIATLGIVVTLRMPPLGGHRE